MNAMDPCRSDRRAPDLLIRPYPDRTEGPMGYQLRLAEDNFMTLRDFEATGFHYDPIWLAGQHLLPPEALDPELHAYVARLANFLSNNARIWNHRFARCCPWCLAEGLVWQAGWEILFHDVCPRHGVWLVDQCGSCRQPIRWHRDSLLRCQCGSDLREETCSDAPEGTRHLSAILEARLLGRDVVEAFPVLAGLDVEQIQRLIRYLGGYMDPMAGPKPLKLKNAGWLQASWTVSSLAAEILGRWPQAFHDCWTRMQSNADETKAGLNGVFRQAYFYLYKGLGESAFLPVRETFETWLCEHWKGGLCKRNRRVPLELLANVQWIPGKVAADDLGISLTRLRSLIQEGLVDGQETISGAGRRFLVVRRDQLKQVNLQLANEVTMTEAMAMLGIGKVRMQRLLRLLFPGARRIGDKEQMPWCVPRHEVEALLAVSSCLPVTSIPEENQVSLTHVLKYWTWTAKEIVALIEEVREGRMAPLSVLDNSRGIGRWVFDAARLRAWQASLRGDGHGWLSIPEAAAVLGIKQQVAYWLTQNGHLPVSEKLGTTKKDGARVRREDVSRFRQDHIYGSEIAAELKTSSRKAAELLAAYGIHSLKGHSKHPSRKIIYRYNEDVRRFLLMVTGKMTTDLPPLGGYSNRKIGSDENTGPPHPNSDTYVLDNSRRRFLDT